MQDRAIKTLSDSEIIDLYWSRDEQAIMQTDIKYRAYLLTVAENILQDDLDSEECLNDTYIAAWNSMPPRRPNVLKAFLSTIIRRKALVVYRNSHRQKRIGNSQVISLTELGDIVTETEDRYTQSDVQNLTKILEKFVDGLDRKHRYVFLARFYIGKSIDEIAQTLGVHRSKVNRMLTLIRQSLRSILESEGIDV